MSISVNQRIFYKQMLQEYSSPIKCPPIEKTAFLLLAVIEILQIGEFFIAKGRRNKDISHFSRITSKLQLFLIWLANYAFFYRVFIFYVPHFYASMGYHSWVAKIPGDILLMVIQIAASQIL